MDEIESFTDDVIIALLQKTVSTAPRYNWHHVKDMLEVVFERVPDVNVREQTYTAWRPRTGMQILISGLNTDLLRWFLSTGRLSPDFDAGVLQSVSPHYVRMLETLLEFSPDVLKVHKVEVMHDYEEDKYELITGASHRVTFDRRHCETHWGNTLDLAKTIWGSPPFEHDTWYTSLVDWRRRVLNEYANRIGVAQLFVCFKRAQVECVLEIASMAGVWISESKRYE